MRLVPLPWFIRRSQLTTQFVTLHYRKPLTQHKVETVPEYHGVRNHKQSSRLHWIKDKTQNFIILCRGVVTRLLMGFNNLTINWFITLNLNKNVSIGLQFVILHSLFTVVNNNFSVNGKFYTIYLFHSWWISDWIFLFAPRKPWLWLYNFYFV